MSSTAIDNRLPVRELEPVTPGQIAALFYFAVCTVVYVSSLILKYVKTWRGRPGGYHEVATDSHGNYGHDAPAPSKHVFTAPGNFFLSLSNNQIVKWSCYLGLCMGYLYLCDRSPYVDRGSKSYSRDIYLFLNGIFILWSLLDIRKSHSTAILNRDQTEEWKGWMQFAFLAYHYFNAREAYNAIRVFVGAYVWMTGFGNFSYFYIKNDYSVIRLFSMLWRLNFLVLVMMLVMNRAYMLYYIVPLHTTWFLFVYCMMRIARRINYTELGMKMKLVSASLVIFILWEFKTLFLAIFVPLQWLLGLDGTLHEWFFRSFLDHWSPLWGMIFAFNFPLLEKMFVHLEKSSKVTEWSVKGSVSVVLIGCFYMWLKDIYSLDKFSYNRHHPYFEIIPILTWIWFRNLTITLRSHYAHTLTRLGQITLETYLCQFHIFLADDAKSLVVLIPHYPYLNCLLVTLIYVLVAKVCFNATVEIRSAIMPRDLTPRGLMRGILYGIAFCVGLLFVGFILLQFNQLFWPAFVVSVVAGCFCLVHLLMHNA